MKELAFKHSFDQELYDKASMKFSKMIETESGQKFFTHLVKAFIHSESDRKVEQSENPNGLLQCDLTKVKLIATKDYDKFYAVYKAKMATFVKQEDETEEQFENRLTAYLTALTSSNPYAVNAAFGFTADKTDKILCSEALTALCDMYNKICNEYDKDSDLYKMIQPVEKKFKKRTKPQKKQKKVTTDKTVTQDDLLKLKAKFMG